MMTEDEAKERAKELIKTGDMIEAGFVLIMLRHAPNDVPHDEVRAYRQAFFYGTQYMFDLLHTQLVGGDEAIEDLLDRLLAELKKFNKNKYGGMFH